MSQKSIPPDLEPAILAKSGEGLSAQAIAAWLLSEHHVEASRPAVQRFLARIAKERKPIAQAVARSKLSKEVVADLDAVNGVLERARADEKAAAQTDDVLAELQRLALVDVSMAFGPGDAGLLPLDKMPEEVRKAISSFEIEQINTEVETDEGPRMVNVGKLVKVKFWDKTKALDQLTRLRLASNAKDIALKARDQQLKALALRLELSGAGGGNEDTLAARTRMLAKLEAEATA